MQVRMILARLAAVAALFASAEASFLTNKTQKFAVDGATLPEFPFDLGESYAGNLPVTSNQSDTDTLWFWFVPSSNPDAPKNEIVVYLEGGPGCTSLLAMFYEEGPFTWKVGTIEPAINPWAWTNLTNVMWIDQPIGTGYSTGTPTITGEVGLAKQFLGFWKNFIETFDLFEAKIHLVGESYGGRYVPYIGNAMLDKNDTKYYNLQGSMLIDPLIASHDTQQNIQIVPFVEHWNNVFNLNSTFIDTIREASAACGYDDYAAENFVFPGNPDANATLPDSDLTYTFNGITHSCGDIITDINSAITRLNPCFDNTHVTGVCPKQFSSIGYPTFVTEGTIQKRAYPGEVYLDRSDVKTALHAPSAPWIECNQFGVSASSSGNLVSPQPIFSKLPQLIERTNRTMIVHGSLDMLVTINGTLLALQNMTWNGAQGFSKYPSDIFTVPEFSGVEGAAGEVGRVLSERGLTWVEVWAAGHEVPEYAPSASFRQVEFLLGRVDSLSGVPPVPFTTDPNA